MNASGKRVHGIGAGRSIGAVLVLLVTAASLSAQSRWDVRSVGMFNQYLYFGSIGLPRGLAFDAKNNELWVCDSTSDRMAVFTPGGQELYSFVSRPSTSGASRVSVSPAGDLAVLSNDRSAVRMFSYRGQYKGEFPPERVGEKPVLGAVTFDSQGNLYIADNATSQVFAFRPDGKLRFQFGSRGSEEGQFLSVCDLLVDPAGNIYVLDQRAIAVQVFDGQGNFVRGWGRHEMGGENFSLPSGIALDAQGRVLVTDELRHQVKVFSGDGKLLWQFGGLGPGVGQLSLPTDVAVGLDGSIYVSERGNTRIQVFQLREIVPTNP